MEISPGIHMISGQVGTRPLQLFLLSGADRHVLLDTGCAPDPERLVFPYLERLEILDHVIAPNEAHLRRLIREYVSDHHEDRIHDSLEKDTSGRRKSSPIQQRTQS